MSRAEIISGFEQVKSFLAKIEQGNPKVENSVEVTVQPEQECQDAR